MATLIVTKGEGEGNFYPLGTRTSVIGRDDGVPIQIVDPHVSRKHAQVRYNEETDLYYALDMKSRHGTFVNGTRIYDEEVPLSNNDVLDVGGVTLLFTTQDVKDRQGALAYRKQVGERYRGTLKE